MIMHHGHLQPDMVVTIHVPQDGHGVCETLESTQTPEVATNCCISPSVWVEIKRGTIFSSLRSHDYNGCCTVNRVAR